MKMTLILLCMLFMLSCSKRDSVNCVCYGSNNQEDVYYLGIKSKPSLKESIAQCDTMAVHNGLDSCGVFTEGY